MEEPLHAACWALKWELNFSLQRFLINFHVTGGSEFPAAEVEEKLLFLPVHV